MGDTKKWIIGFFDSMSGAGAFSQEMDMKLSPPEPKKDYKKTSNFPSIGAHNFCGENSKCKGWSMHANYTVETDADGKSSLEVAATVTSPKKLRKTSIFGAGWALEAGKKLTEGYITMWMY